MPSRLSKILLFFSAYFPLLTIFTAQYYEKYRMWAVVPCLIGLIALIWLAFFINLVRGSAPRRAVVESVQRKDAEVISYLFTYIFPFLELKVDDLFNVIGLSIFFLVLMILYVNSNLIHINPMLNLLGYHLYEVSLGDGTVHTILTRRSRLVRGTKLDIVLISDDLSVEK